MKPIFFLLLLSSILVVSCNNNKTPEEKATDQATDNMNSVVENIQKNKDDILKGKEELQKLTPLSIDELKKLVPETLMGAERSSYNATKTMGAGLVNSTYKLNDSTKITVNIYDCAGPAGAGIYSMQYLGMMNIEQDSEDEYTKTVNYGDGKAYEHCRKDRNDCTLTWFAGGRFLVTLDGDNVDAETLKKAGKELTF